LKELKGAQNLGEGAARGRGDEEAVPVAGAVDVIGTVSVRAAVFTEPPVATYQPLPLWNASPNAPEPLPSTSLPSNRKTRVAGLAKFRSPGEIA